MGDQTIDDTIDSFADLRPGWDGHEGTVITERVRHAAKDYIAKHIDDPADGMVAAFPGSDGSILIAFRFCGLPVEISIGPEEE